MNNDLNSIANLKDYWKKTLIPLVSKPEATEPVFLGLLRAYSAPHRFYHNLEHLEQVLRVIEEMSFLSRNTTALLLAAWFHDFVYDSTNQNNEEKSAAEAEVCLGKLKLPISLIKTVRELILITKKHWPQTGDIDQYILLDADLAIFGTAPVIYQSYLQKVRQEYAWVPIEEYRKKRQEILQIFLDRDRIYFTDYWCDKFEAQARKNIEAEIAYLTNRAF